MRHPIEAGLVRLLLISTAIAVLPAVPERVQAQEAVTAQVIRYSIEGGELRDALTAFSEISGVQLVYESELVRGLQSGGLSGEYSVTDALQQLLQGSGLVARFRGPRTASLVRVETEQTRVLGPVRVEGVAASRVSGINGSTDVTATEGTGSYTSGALSIASKAPRSIKDTPQSVSVMTQQRMQDQNITDFDTAMKQSTGITLVTGSSLQSYFYSRGFEVTRIQIDGGAPLTTLLNSGYRANFVPLIDMAMYDHVELLRGADGMFNGYGDPGGTVNLSRKRPLDHSRVAVELQAGSWSNYRTVLDATAPLGFDGKLRGRAVFSYQDQDYFYDIASNNHTLSYAVLEMDLTPDTLLSGGLSFTRQNAVPWFNGLPRFQTGDDLRLPRDTCLCFPWSRWDFETVETFAELRQDLGRDWSFGLKMTRLDQESQRKAGYGAGSPIHPDTLAGSRMSGTMSDYSSVQTLLDATVRGELELFGLRHEIVVGANYSDTDIADYVGYAALLSGQYVGPTGEVGQPSIDVFRFDPYQAKYGEPPSPPISDRYPDGSAQRQWGAYANFRIALAGSLHLSTGLRYSHYDNSLTQESICPSALYIRLGVCDTIGEVYSVSRREQSAHDFSWPPAYSLVYSPGAAWSLYASYADIYQPQDNQLGFDLQPVEPVTGSNVEAGIKFELGGGAFNATLAAYRIRQENFTKYLGCGEFCDTNGALPDGMRQCCYDNSSARVRLSEGIDSEITGELLPGWQVFAGYTFNTNKVEYPGDWQDGKPLVSRSPKHLLKLWTTYQFQSGEWLRRLSVGGGVNAQTEAFEAGSACVAYEERPNQAGIPVRTCVNSQSYDYTQESYALLSVRAAYRIGASWNLALNINNLTDKVYYQSMGTSESANWYGEPRSFTLSLHGAF